jgi:hypothetical protein
MTKDKTSSQVREFQKILIDCFRELNIEIAGKFGDPLRWAASDLAADLAPVLVKNLKLNDWLIGGPFDDDEDDEDD